MHGEKSDETREGLQHFLDEKDAGIPRAPVYSTLHPSAALSCRSQDPSFICLLH